MLLLPQHLCFFYCCVGIPVLVVLSVIAALRKSSNDDKSEQDHRYLSALNPIKDSYTATVSLGVFFLIICLPLLVRLGLNTYRNIESITNNRAPRHSTWNLVLATSAGGAAVGATTGMGFGIASMVTWFIFFAGITDFYFNTYANHNSQFEKFFSLTSERFNLIVGMAKNYRHPHSNESLSISKFLSTLGAKLMITHRHYIEQGELSDPDAGRVKRTLYTQCISGFYYLSPSSQGLQSLQSGDQQNAFDQMIQEMSNQP